MNQDLFSALCDFRNIHRAYQDAKKSKRFKKDILAFGFSVEDNLSNLRENFLTGAYRHGGYRSFIVVDSKKRKIEVAPFRDRIVHHAVVNVIEPIFEKSFIYDSYACRKGKGTHAAIFRTKKFMAGVSENFTKRAYFLQFDVKKYFESIDHGILLRLIQKKIKDVAILGVIEEIVRSKLGDKGIPIGNLTSQLFANIYLNELDHFIKEKLGVRYYLRYMDDFLIFHEDPKKLVVFKREVDGFVSSELLLKLGKKRSGIELADRVDFLGYVLFPHYVKLRKSTVSRAVRRFRKKGAISSLSEAWNGYAKFADAYALMKKLLS
jgi:retron-type reverse transcriptase